MTELGQLKPILATLLLPPAAPLLLALLGLLLATRKRAAGLALSFAAVALLWLLSCHAVAVWLAQNALPQFAPVSVASLKNTGVQAIVVLGGGVRPTAPEYGEPQASLPAAARLRYGVWLARQTGLPVAFAGSRGWGAADAPMAYILPHQNRGLEWLPSVEGLQSSRVVLKEWLALRVASP